jgi:tetratricopeptide (TPR) repeat protein
LGKSGKKKAGANRRDKRKPQISEPKPLTAEARREARATSAGSERTGLGEGSAASEKALTDPGDFGRFASAFELAGRDPGSSPKAGESQELKPSAGLAGDQAADPAPDSAADPAPDSAPDSTSDPAKDSAPDPAPDPAIEALVDLNEISRKGAQAFMAKDKALAEKLFARALAIDPEFEEAQKFFALILLESAEPLRARPYLERLLAKNQNDFKVWAMLSRLEKNGGDLAAAKSAAERSLLINPEQPGLKAWLDSLATEAIVTGQKDALAPKSDRLALLVEPGDDEEINLLGAKLERILSVRKVASLKEAPYVEALSGRGALWFEGLSPRLRDWLKKLPVREQPTIVRLTEKDLFREANDDWAFPAVTGVIAETKALLELILAKGFKPRHGARLLVAPKVVDPRRFPKPVPPKEESEAQAASGSAAEISAAENSAPEISSVESSAVEISGNESSEDIADATGPSKAKTEETKATSPLSLAFLGPWDEPGVIIEAFLVAKRFDPAASLWSRKRPDTPVKAKILDWLIGKNGLAGSVLFANDSLGQDEFFNGRTHLLDVAQVAGGAETPLALSYGLRPLIRNSPGADELYPADYLWLSVSDLPELFKGPPSVCPIEWAQKFARAEILLEKAVLLL